MDILKDWQSFYGLVGASAGALIGLQFIAIALLADMPTTENMIPAAQAFGTPNVVHFGVALLLSGTLSAPWSAPKSPAAICGGVGLAGVVYVLTAAWKLRRQTVYQPEPSDWFHYVVLPLSVYTVLTLSACAATSNLRSGLFGIGTAALALLFIGIRNAWDSVTYHIFVQRPAHRKQDHV